MNDFVDEAYDKLYILFCEYFDNVSLQEDYYNRPEKRTELKSANLDIETEIKSYLYENLKDGS